MLKKIEGADLIELYRSGIENLEAYCNILNDLNVFPVPDGDTGTNMVMTLKYGYESIKHANAPLSEIAASFATSAVFGARGNSGVITSQFFKGISEELYGKSEANASQFSSALTNGYKYAYDSVAKPVEGTILTVLKDATSFLEDSLPLESINEAIDIFLKEAERSLKNTPELLPILKKAGVVDSGASGIVYFFEGIQKYLNGEKIENAKASDVDNYIDLSKFNKNTCFEYGYCVEGLLQLLIDVDNFDVDRFKLKLIQLGESVVTTLEKDKLKLHIHTQKLGPIMEHCQSVGEFLTLKIENMTVQNLKKIPSELPPIQKFLYSEEREPSEFAVVAVASNTLMQQLFFDMGADVVIMSDVSPSSQDFIDAFKYAQTKEILVFPNSSNSLLASMQAGSLYRKAKVTVLNSRSPVECYASLSIMDFDGGIDNAISIVNDTISNMYQISVYHATKDIKYGNRHISKNDFFALSDNKILNIGISLDDVTLNTVEKVLNNKEYGIVTLFYGKYVSEDCARYIAQRISSLGFDIEVALVSTFETVYNFIITFE